MKALFSALSYLLYHNIELFEFKKKKKIIIPGNMLTYTVYINNSKSTMISSLDKYSTQYSLNGACLVAVRLPD